MKVRSDIYEDKFTITEGLSNPTSVRIGSLVTKENDGPEVTPNVGLSKKSMSSGADSLTCVNKTSWKVPYDLRTS